MSTQTHNTIPQQGSAFYADLQTFLRQEDAQRYADQFSGMVVSGGIHSTAMSLTATPSSLTAYPGGYYITETGAVTYQANATNWLIAHKDTTGDLGTFVRQPGTHYLTDSISVSKPTIPADCILLLEVTTNGSAITAVVDWRTRVPYMGVYRIIELPTPGVRGRTAFVTNFDTNGALVFDDGVQWQYLATNPMSVAADLIVGGDSGAPVRLEKGAVDQILSMDSTATFQEWRTLTAGTGIGISYATGTITIAQTVFPPTGEITMFFGTSAPTGFLLCDSAEFLCDTEPNLAKHLIPYAVLVGKGTKVGDFTADAGTDVCTLPAHGLVDGQIVHVATGGTLPANLNASTVYYIRDSTLSTFKLSLTSGGTAVDIQSAGSGTHSIYNKIQTPDLRGRVPLGLGTGSGLTARTLGQQGGEETHTLTASEIQHTNSISADGAHSHTVQGGTVILAGGNYDNSTDTAPNHSHTGATGTATMSSATAHNNMNPFTVVNFIIKT